MPLEEQNGQKIGANEQLGSYLKRMREEHDLPIEKLAKSVRLSVDVISDIESGNWDKFPIEAYTRSYLTSLCDKFNLDKQLVLEKFNEESKSQYSIDQHNVKKIDFVNPRATTNSNPKATIIIVVGILVVLLSVVKILSSSGEADDEQADETYTTQQPAMETDVTDSAAIADSVATNDSVVPAPTPAVVPVALPNTKDSLRLECFPTPTDSICAVKYRGQTYNFRRFTIVRDIPHNDSATVFISVPARTRLHINGVRTDYGINNTVVLYGGEVVKKYNARY